MNTALKEWSAVVEALGAGRQIVLFRKGGIVEAKQGFELRHATFLLFPTWEHQHARLLKPGMLAGVPPREGLIEIRYRAEATDIFSAPADLAALRRADAYHIWNETFFAQRLQYRPDLPLYAVLLRVFRLPQPQLIPDRPSYAGCKSWVHLTEEIGLPGEQPVLGDEAFAAERAAVRRELAVE